jgi:hypothetical protein
MRILTFRVRFSRFVRANEGAVTADWVVLTAMVVGLCGAGYSAMRDGATGLADNTSSFLTTYLD